MACSDSQLPLMMRNKQKKSESPRLKRRGILLLFRKKYCLNVLSYYTKFEKMMFNLRYQNINSRCVVATFLMKFLAKLRLTVPGASVMGGQNLLPRRLSENSYCIENA